MNGTLVKNELILEFASGKLNASKSVFAATYLFLNSKAANISSAFENLHGDSLLGNKDTPTSNLKFSDCLSSKVLSRKIDKSQFGPLSKVVGSLDNIEWKQIFKGFKEFSTKIDDRDELKLIKMDPGTSVPLHSHGGKEYILVLDGSFCDEHGKYTKGDIQINDQKIKHTPIASEKHGCLCLTITEKDVIFFGSFGSFLNLFTFIRSFFK
tara:strand:+ start:2558 stop:3187 length:630 start_codon:yes stop_codon:yes gene_type:complete